MLLFSAGALRAQTNTFPTTGNVGIGTLSPASALEVVGSSKLGGASNNIAVDANGNPRFLMEPLHIKLVATGMLFNIAAIPITVCFSARAMFVTNSGTGAATATFLLVQTMVMAIFFGNLGLGVQSAAAKLDVAGTVKSPMVHRAPEKCPSDANGLASWQTSTGGGTITGTGAAGNLAFWTGATALGTNANLFWDNTNGRLGSRHCQSC